MWLPDYLLPRVDYIIFLLDGSVLESVFFVTNFPSDNCIKIQLRKELACNGTSPEP